MLTIAKEDENKEGIYKNSEYYSIPMGTNLDGIVLGSGYLPNVNVSHTYNLTLRYIDSDDIDQTTDMYAKFYARVNVRGSDIATITFDLDGGTLNNFFINEQSKSRIAKNTSVYIPVPVKDDYAFEGWEIISGEGTIKKNNLNVKSENITIKALWMTSTPFEFDYTGGEQQFIAQYSGYYKLEIWGAQGGSYSSSYYGGYGGYSIGTANLTKGEILYINVGGQGYSNSSNSGPITTAILGGYNGGGTVYPESCCNGHFPSSGGGATHIATLSGLLSKLENEKNSILIVSGGGGGAFGHSNVTLSYIGGNGGGIEGMIGGGQVYDLGGTQDVGYAFGLGGQDYDKSRSAGGGGYYGGKHTGGGSGYIGNILLTDKYMYCYNCTTSDVESTKTYSTTCVEETPTENCAKIGNGYARITYLHN